jgi:hypothetical protein
VAGDSHFLHIPSGNTAAMSHLHIPTSPSQPPCILHIPPAKSGLTHNETQRVLVVTCHAPSLPNKCSQSSSSAGPDANGFSSRQSPALLAFSFDRDMPSYQSRRLAAIRAMSPLRSCPPVLLSSLISFSSLSLLFHPLHIFLNVPLSHQTYSCCLSIRGRQEVSL